MTFPSVLNRAVVSVVSPFIPLSISLGLPVLPPRIYPSVYDTSSSCVSISLTITGLSKVVPYVRIVSMKVVPLDWQADPSRSVLPAPPLVPYIPPLWTFLFHCWPQCPLSWYCTCLLTPLYSSLPGNRFVTLVVWFSMACSMLLEADLGSLG